MLAVLALAAAAQTIDAVPVPDGAIRVDGLLDEAEWAAATPVANFARFQPTAGGAPPGTTEVRFLADDRNLYVGVRVRGADYPIRARISPREQIFADDQIGLYLDPFGEAQSGYIFYLNPLGIQEDTRHSGGAGFEAWNMSWDTLFRSEGHLVDGGYDLEVAIPFRSLKFPGKGGEQDWGVMITRKIPSRGEKYGYPRLERDHPRMWTQAASLRVRTPPRGSGLELVPGLTVVQQAGRDDIADPMAWTGFENAFASVRPSLDLRYGLTPSIGLTAAVNPDFSQVENDETPIDLNERFSFFFPEKRPFFLDGDEYFQDLPGTVYTRSIVDPTYGVKTYGTSGEWSLGVLHALDRGPAPSLAYAGTPGFGVDDVEGALALNTIARAERNVGDGGAVGLVLADKEVLRDGEVGGTNRVAGLDAALPLGGRWTAYGVLQGSRTEAPGEEGLWGMDRAIILERASGIGTGMALAVVDITPGHRRETGFLPNAGLTQISGGVDHTFETEGAVDVVRAALEGIVVEERDGDGQFAGGPELNVVIGGVHELEVQGGYDGYDEAGVHVDGWYAEAQYAGEAGAALAWELYGEVGRELDYDVLAPASSAVAGVFTTLRPTPGLRADIGYEHRVLDPEGAAAELADRLRAKLGWQLSRELGTRVIAEYTAGTAFEPAVTSSLLLTYLANPGTAVYMGYAETTSVEHRAALDRTIFAKGTFLLRL